MKLYFAGLTYRYTDRVYWHSRDLGCRYLYSYAYFKNEVSSILRYHWTGRDIFVDSGGFTAREQGMKISVEAYRDFLLKMRGTFSACASLDTLSLEESHHNQRVLEKAGLSPIPVYHYSEYDTAAHRDLINSYLGEYPYIALGGVAGRKLPRHELFKFYDFVFNRVETLTNRKAKIHAFGVTSTAVMSRYPFYSVDSTTWVMPGKFGDVIQLKGGKYRRVAKRNGKITHHRMALDKYDRVIHAVDTFKKMEDYLTKLWKSRGYSWD